MKILRLKSGVKRRSLQLLQLKRFLQNDDPFEQRNLALNPAFKEIKDQVLNKMESLVVESLGF